VDGGMLLVFPLRYEATWLMRYRFFHEETGTTTQQRPRAKMQKGKASVVSTDDSTDKGSRDSELNSGNENDGEGRRVQKVAALQRMRVRPV
jgi:hypothetical protein